MITTEKNTPQIKTVNPYVAHMIAYTWEIVPLS